MRMRQQMDFDDVQFVIPKQSYSGNLDGTTSNSVLVTN